MASTSPFHLHNLSSHHHHPLPRSLPLRLKHPSFSISSSRPNHNPHTITTTTTSNPLAPLLKPACITLTAAALLLSSFRRPSLAAPLPPTHTSQTQTLKDDEGSLEEYLDKNPEDVRALRTLMELKAKASKYPEAIDALDRILILQPDDPDLPLLRAHLLTHSGDHRSARIAFDELLNKDPFLVEAYHGLVMVASFSEPAEEAAEELRKVLERVEGVMERCKKEKRREQLRDLKLLVAQVKVVERKYGEALRVYQDLVKEEPRDFRPYLCQGIVYSVLRRYDEAEMQFEKYRRLVPRGHPYSKYFDENVVATKVFGEMVGKKASTLR